MMGESYYRKMLDTLMDELEILLWRRSVIQKDLADVRNKIQRTKKIIERITIASK